MEQTSSDGKSNPPAVEEANAESRPSEANIRGWSKPVKKTIYTLNIGDYAPEICALTYPLIEAYAEKIGADFYVIKERKFPLWPLVYEKLQIYELARKHANDWNIFIDSDTLINPEMFDVTEHLNKDTVCHNGRDMAGIRWKYDQYFRRDGRHIGSCNWFTIASDWCLDLWRPLDDLTLDEAITNITITVAEMNSGLCSTEHLIDDYTVSRNIARFGLKVQTVMEMCAQLGWRNSQGLGTSPFLYHKYTISNEQKAWEMLGLLTAPLGQPGPFGSGWGIMNQATAAEYRKRFWTDAKSTDRVRAASPSTEVERSLESSSPGSHIQGWMGTDELQWLHSTAKEMSSAVEVGCWKGRSTFALCSSGCPRLIVVDHFRGSPEHQKEFGFAHGWSPYPEFESNILRRFGSVELMKKASADAAAEIPDGSVDMVFLDGAHDYPAVRDDLAAWAPKATRVVALHARSYPWVQQAGEEYFGRPADEIVGEIAVFRK